MSLEISIPTEESSLQPNIVVIGVGGAGGNAINNMIESSLEGVHFIATNTDAQALEHSSAPIRIQLGANITKGLGAGAKPHIGRAAAEETLDEITQHIEKAHMVFIAAGMGGGTGTGASSVIARASKERGILTIGVVTKPFHFEGKPRMRIAEEGIIELEPFVDTLLVIPNQNLFRLANEKTTFSDAFKMADNVLYSGVRGITDLMLMPGLINLDFADVRTIMSEMGTAMMGTGESSGDNRALSAAQIAISNPLLDDVSLKGAKGVLINVTGGDDMTLFEVDQAAGYIREQVDDNANIIFGSTFDTKITGSIRVSIVATGIENGKRYASPATHHGSAHNNSVDQEKPCKTTLSKNSTRSENINDMDSLFFSVKQRLEEATRILRETKTETLDSQEVVLNQEKNITTAHESNPIDPIDLTSSPEATQETQQDLFSIIHHPASAKGSPTKDLLDIPAFLRRKGRS